MCCLSLNFWQVTSVQNFKTFTVLEHVCLLCEIQFSEYFQGYHVQPIVMDTNTPSVPRVASPVDSTVSQSAGASRRSLSYADTARSSTVMPSDPPVWPKIIKKIIFFLPSYFQNQNMLAYYRYFVLNVYAFCREPRVLDLRPRSRGFEPHPCHWVVVLEQDTFILA